MPDTVLPPSPSFPSPNSPLLPPFPLPPCLRQTQAWDLHLCTKDPPLSAYAAHKSAFCHELCTHDRPPFTPLEKKITLSSEPTPPPMLDSTLSAAPTLLDCWLRMRESEVRRIHSSERTAVITAAYFLSCFLFSNLSFSLFSSLLFSVFLSSRALCVEHRLIMVSTTLKYECALVCHLFCSL